MLEDEDSGIHSQIISALGEIKTGSAVPVLVARIRDRGASASGPELSALQSIGEPSAEALLGVLRENAQNARQAPLLIKSLEAIGGQNIADGFLALISAKFPSLIVPLAEALIRLDEQRVLQALVEVLSGSSGEAWSARVVEILEELGWSPGDASQQALVSLAKHDWKRLAELGGPAVLLLGHYLTSASGPELKSAAEALGQIGDDRAVEPLAALLNHRREEIAVAAARALGLIEGGQSVEMLLQTSVDTNSALLQAEAEKSLARIGAAAVRPLLDQLHSSDPRERKTAVRILGEIGDRQALPFLVSARDDPSLQPELDLALGTMGWEPPGG
jgi:HEAT repeat protein